ncbi:MAG: phosphate ABC transporter permease PstA [Candidatus Levyibacteriota bacterium]
MNAQLRKVKITNQLGIGLLWTIAGIVSFLFIGIIIYLVLQGVSYLFNPAFYGIGVIGIGSEIFNTFYILLLSEVILLPIALAAAIYLTEYAKQGRLVTIIHFAAETLASVPSLVLGLFGVLIFVISFHLGTSRLAGALTLLCLNLPLALRLFEDAILSVPRTIREGGLALGATKWHTIRTLVLPSALPGIITAVILTAGRTIGEAAALLFTMGLYNPSNVFTPDWSIASDTLTTHLYNVTGPGSGSLGLTSSQETIVAAGSSALLILLLLLINTLSRTVGSLMQKKIMAT